MSSLILTSLLEHMEDWLLNGLKKNSSLHLIMVMINSWMFGAGPN